MQGPTWGAGPNLGYRALTLGAGPNLGCRALTWAAGPGTERSLGLGRRQPCWGRRPSWATSVKPWLGLNSLNVTKCKGNTFRRSGAPISCDAAVYTRREVTFHAVSSELMP